MLSKYIYIYIYLAQYLMGLKAELNEIVKKNREKPYPFQTFCRQNVNVQIVNVNEDVFEREGIAKKKIACLGQPKLT